MTGSNTCDDALIRLAADLDAGTVAAVHTRLLSALDEIEASEASGVLEVDVAEGAVSPLSLQLLVSASRSFPADRLRLGHHATAALAALESKEF